MDESVLAQFCSGDGNTCSLALFEAFLSNQQMQDHVQAADIMREAINDRERDVAQPSFRADEVRRDGLLGGGVSVEGGREAGLSNEFGDDR